MSTSCAGTLRQLFVSRIGCRGTARLLKVTDLTMIRRKVQVQQIWVGYQGHPLRNFPQRFMALDIDSESLVRDATLLVRSPREFVERFLPA
jgi:hypothetical protein